jgi:hypothetical protein
MGVGCPSPADARGGGGESVRSAPLTGGCAPPDRSEGEGGSRARARGSSPPSTLSNNYLLAPQPSQKKNERKEKQEEESGGGGEAEGEKKGPLCCHDRPILALFLGSIPKRVEISCSSQRKRCMF